MRRGWDRYRSWPVWARILVGVVVLAVVLAPFTGGDEDGDDVAASDTTEVENVDEGEDTTTTESTTTTTEAATTSTTTTTTEPPTTTTTTTPPPVVYEGRGDQVLEITKPVPGGPAIAVIGHDGSSNFQITALDADLERVGGMVNEIGTYQGVRPVDFLDGTSSAFLEINADGAWRIELQPVTMARRFSDVIDGAGDDVVYYEGDTGAAHIIHNGESNFQVISYDDRRDGMVNEIGSYEGSVPLRGGVFIEVVADGGWSIST